jgi:hypothetical protein
VALPLLYRLAMKKTPQKKPIPFTTETVRRLHTGRLVGVVGGLAATCQGDETCRPLASADPCGCP